MEDYSQLESKIGITFKDKDLLTQSFIHKSYINENRDQGLDHNERLEFLGDAVLELVVTRHLFDKYPQKDEGTLTTFRSALVKGKHLAEIAENLELGKYLFLSKGEEKSGGRQKSYILANTLEAFIGAIYIEQGYETAREFISKFILTRLDEIIAQGLHMDSKSRFQEMAQEIHNTTPHYEILKEEGPDHDKLFTVGAFIGDDMIASGQGSSKQKAQDQAAQEAIKAKGWE